MEKIDHEAIRELIPVVVLHAASESESELVEAHVKTCPECRSEFTRLEEVVASLAVVAAEPPPEGLYRRILSRMRETDKPLRPPVVHYRSRVSYYVKGLPKLARVLAAAALAVTVAAFGAVGYLASDVAALNAKVARLSTLSSEASVQRAAQMALVNARSLRIPLTLPNDPHRYVAELVVLPSGQAFFLNLGLPPLPPNKTYQLWGVVGDTAISLGVFGNRPATVAFSLAPRSPFARFALTAEVAGGVVISHNPPVAAGSA